jgi:5-amino-6-(5-phospho-D-ribitylamino)uracil phosphatase
MQGVTGAFAPGLSLLSNRMMLDATSVRLVACDLDGTLLNGDKQIAPQTREAIRQLGAKGVRFVIASARPPRSVRHLYKQLQLDTLQINYNGALVWDQVTQRVVDHRPLPGSLALEIIRFARAMDTQVLVTCEILDRWHTDRFDNTYSTATGELFGPDVIEPVEQFCRGKVTKLLLLGPGGTMQAMRPQVLQQFGDRVNMVCTEPELLQIMEKSVSKAAALRLLVERYDVGLGQVLAIGDGENDLEMLTECGIGAAVANASPALKRAATWVAPRANSLGVLDILQRYCGV